MEEEKKITPQEESFLKAGEFMEKYYSTYSSMLSPYKDRINEWRKDYNCIPDKRSEGLSNTFVPESYIAVETIVADLVSLLLGYDPPFVGAEVTQEYAEHKKQMERLVWQLMQDGEFRRKAIWYIRGLAKDGIKPCYVHFNNEKKKVKDKLRSPTDGKFGIQEVEKSVKFFPDFDCPDVIDSFFDPMTHELKSIMLQWKLSWDKIKGLANQGRINKELLETLKTAGATTTTGNEQQKKDQKFSDLGFEKAMSPQDDEYLLRVFFGDIPAWWINTELKDKEEGEEMVVGEVLTVNGVTAGINANDYLDGEIPVIMGKWIENDNQMSSHSAISPTHLTQLALNTTRDQEIDFKTFSLYFIWLKSRQANVSNADLKVKPNQIIEVDGDVRAALAQWRPDPSAFQAGNVMEGTLKGDIQRSSSATASRQGMAAGSRTTAEEVQTMQQRGSMRNYIIALSIAETWFKPLLKKYWDLVKQNVDKPIEVLGQGGEIILPDSIYGDYKFIPKVLTDPMNIVTMRNSIMGLMDTLGRVPEYAGSAIYNLAKKRYEIEGWKDAEVIFPPKDPLASSQNPEDENKVLNEGKLTPAQPYHNHLAHIEKHLPEMQKAPTAAAKAAYDEHIKHHFAFTNASQAGMVNPTAGLTPPPPPIPGAPSPLGGQGV